MMCRMWASLTLAVVFLLPFTHADSCSCKGGKHLQVDYCAFLVVMKVKILSIVQIYDQPEDNPSEDERNRNTGCEIEVLEVFQGGPKLMDMKFMASYYFCPRNLSHFILNTIYLVPAYYINDEGIEISTCQSVFLWSEVTEQQLKGIQGEYSIGCSCAIADSEGGFTTNWCLQDKREQQVNQRCVPKTNTTCDWEDVPV